MATTKSSSLEHGVYVLVGTHKGGFVCKSNSKRKNWKVTGPFFSGYNTFDIVADGSNGRSKPTFFAAVNTWTWGPVIQKSTDLGKTWKKAKAHPRFPEQNEKNLKVENIWNLQPDGTGRIYAGVEPAALFATDDESNSWRGFDSLNFHETRDKWNPGAGGLCLHTIRVHPKDKKKLRVGISAVGVIGSEDGGDSWKFMNKGIKVIFAPEKYPEWGQCVHKMDSHPEKPDTLYLQNHGGVYVSDDFGSRWTPIDKGLPSDFGFPIAVNSLDPDTVYVVPLEPNSRYPPNGQMQVWRSSNGGKKWVKLSKGLPNGVYFNVLREAMSVDSEDPCGIYLGTTTGQLYYSSNGGNSWETLVDGLPQIYSVSAVSV
jgi:phage pi2 protein 07